MKLTKRVNAPASFMFDQLMKSAINDIKGAMGVVLTVSQLEGYDYPKVFSNKHKARITILQVVENELYQFRTVTNVREFDTTYRLTEIGEDKCDVFIEEKSVTRGTMLKYNDIIMEIIMGRAKKRYFRETMEAIASTYSTE